MLPARPLASSISRYANNPSQLNMKTIIMDATGALTLIRIYTHGIRMMRHLTPYIGRCTCKRTRAGSLLYQQASNALRTSRDYSRRRCVHNNGLGTLR